VTADTASITDARRRVLEAIAEAARRVGRDAAGVRLVAVTKQVPAEVVLFALAAGCEDLGENRVQEAAAKIPLVAAGGGAGDLSLRHARVRWHLIGPLQSNKARRAVELFDVIEAVDSVELAERLDRLGHEIRPGQPLPTLLEVNVDGDPRKAGFTPAALERDLPALLELRSLRIEGLMTVGRLVAGAEQARPTFVALRSVSERLRVANPSLGPELSMGMSDDFAVAVEEGATIVRLGRALFGERRG
jgi:pyridoxal phosphate enzyme (YggS family)